MSRQNLLGQGLLLFIGLILLGVDDTVDAFVSPCTRAFVRRDAGFHVRVDDPTTNSRSSQLYWGFFRRDKSVEQIDETKTANSDTLNLETTTSDEIPTLEKTTVAVVEPPKILTPEEEATRLRNEAAKSRLEAERMDAELTLRKIEKLEKALKKQQLEAAATMNDNNVTTSVTTTTTTGSSASKKTSQEIQREIDVLLKKVRGETPTPTSSLAVPQNSTSISVAATRDPLWPKYVLPFDEEEFKKQYDILKVMPQFILATQAVQLEMELEVDEVTKKTKPIDAKVLCERFDQLRRQDFSYSKKKPPILYEYKIDAMQKTVESFMASDQKLDSNSNVNQKSWQSDDFTTGELVTALLQADDVNLILKSLKDDARYQSLWDTKDSRSIAQLILEYQYYITLGNTEISAEQITTLLTEEAWAKPFLNPSNMSGTDAVIDSLYPRCTTKKDMVFDGNRPSPIPTESAVKKLIADILPKAKFQATSKPEPVLGGYIIRGSTKLSGDAFIEQLDKSIDQSNLKNQMSVFYVNDFTILAGELDFDPSSTTPPIFPDDPLPVLYVTSANVCREPLPIRLSIVSAFGLATSWYFSVYPFLLNPSIATRVDEQLAIADANMVPDLTWLSDLSLPLFATFMSIQLSHELGHLIVAGANGIRTSPPTFVPSLFTGITSTVTTFRTPPKNTASMFDYAAAGPVAGIITSVLAIAVGCQITSVTSDASLFPALPLEILRQSTLGGGIIEFVLGYDALSLPRAAIGTAAVAGMTVPLHPIAIAGFISLIINALALLPVGSKSSNNRYFMQYNLNLTVSFDFLFLTTATDGGRMAIALFGRAFKISVATLALISILVLGFFGGSDLFLFYFMFSVIFQKGNEIPARNEVDKLDLTRCFVAGGLYVLAALTLIPFQ